MLKGFCALLLLAVVLAAPMQLVAQVYRCETASGVTYSDMPCGASAEEIVVAGDVVDMRGVGASIPAEGTTPGLSGGETVAESGQPLSNPGDDLNDFLAMLRSQREEQISRIDNHLSQLRQQVNSAEFFDMEVSEQDRINNQIAQMESDRASIISEYDALIAEAEGRLD